MKKVNLINKKVISAGLSISLLLGAVGNINCFAVGLVQESESNHAEIDSEENSFDEEANIEEGSFKYHIEREANADILGEVSITGVTDRGSAFMRDSGRLDIPQEVTIDNETYTVTSIGDMAFWDCTSLREITIPGSVESIGYEVFAGCTSLESIEIPNSVTSIGEEAFCGCTSLREITIPDSVESIEDGAFGDCTSLREITIPNSVTRIGAGTFRDCTSLTNIEIPNSVESIGNRAFYDCKRLREITIPGSVESIGEEAFYDCKRLREITIPNSVRRIGNKAFRNCKRLMEVVILGNTHIAKDAFIGCKENLRVTTRPLGTGLFFGCKWRDTIDGVL